MVFINFGERLAEDVSTTPAGRSDCGAVVPEENGQISFRSKGYGMTNHESFVPNTPQTVLPTGSNAKQFTPPQDPTRKQSSYRNLRDFIQADPQLFTKCPIASVTYPTFIEVGTIDVQVDAQGKIILVKEPRYRD